MTGVVIVGKPEPLPDPDKLKDKKTAVPGETKAPIENPNDYKKLYGKDALPLSTPTGHPNSNPHRVLGLMETAASNSLSDSERKKPFQPDAFDIELRGTQNPAELKSNLNPGTLNDAAARIAERPPVSVFDRMIGIRDWLYKLRARLAQLEISGNTQEVDGSSKALSGFTQSQVAGENSKNLTSGVKQEIDALKNQT